MDQTAPATIDTRPLLDWYDRNARKLPWRVGPGDRKLGVVPDPYHVWLSEIMLQQTTVAAVGPYFHAFLRRWPELADLAAAKTDDVMAAWAGLGYYSRARNLKKCAEVLAAEHGGKFPETEAGLLSLPGIGPYTAAAISAIAFDRPATVVDGNVERVVARLFAIDTPLPDAKPELKRLAATLTPSTRPGDFAQGMMDLGATICTPTRPACALCPFLGSCKAQSEDQPDRFPVKGAKTPKPTRKGAAFVCRRKDGAILLTRRPPKGLLGGMAEVPTTAWTADFDPDGALDAAPFSANWRQATGPVRHVFTHFRLELDVYAAEIGKAPAPDGHWWEPAATLDEAALPTVMRKVIAHAFEDALKPKR
ncbi:A/G-specific adenine glycosylase [Rhodobium gokarnense]|uniref:Adenine DNA glycosylase n=1 Tax=Rhodobium gokarnense TaxID=364296 RepID=A0ABT3HCU2_9HYPH|nr:A/G-specific adenine glycosylase [Rhodobium gokarnense]MCW2308229.1 A/G-specific adenine glycosylase [Rhodobium gokarnense]